MARQMFTLAEIATTDLVEELESRKRVPEMGVVSMPQLNKKIWGLRRGKLTIIGARTSHGKSSFAVQIAKDVALQNMNVLYLSLEMSNTELAERMFCNMCEVDNYDLLTGQFDKHAVKYMKWDMEIKGLKLVFSDCLGKSWHEIDEVLSNMTVRPDLVILDYIQAIKGIGNMERGIIDEYIKKFREMAVRYNYAGIIVSQVNRSSQSGKDKTPGIHQLKGTGFLEEHADVVLLLYWPYKAENEREVNKYWLDVAKNRGGPTGSVMLFYYPEYYLFKDPQNKRNISDQEVSEELKKVKDMFNGEFVEGNA